MKWIENHEVLGLNPNTDNKQHYVNSSYLFVLALADKVTRDLMLVVVVGTMYLVELVEVHASLSRLHNYK